MKTAILVRASERRSVKTPAPRQVIRWQRFANSTHRRSTHRRSTLLTLLTLATLFPLRAQSATLQTQTFRLNPGWNAIYLEVQPANNTPSAVFGGVPVQSVWTFAASGSTVDFIQNPNEPIANRSQWLLFVPTNRLESFQNSLHRVQGNRAYLVELAGHSPATLNISGTPSLRPIEWATDGYTLRGLPVDPARAPSFATFFSGSGAHYDSVLRRLKAVYRLNPTGQWTLADADDTIAAGEAYWIFTQGASRFPGPVGVEIPLGDAVDFGTTTESIVVRQVFTRRADFFAPADRAVRVAVSTEQDRQENA